MGDLHQTADWKSEKHVPAIEIEIQKSSENVVEVRGWEVKRYHIQTQSNIT